MNDITSAEIEALAKKHEKDVILILSYDDKARYNNMICYGSTPVFLDKAIKLKDSLHSHLTGT